MSASERIRHELREIGLVSLYFLSCFLVLLSLKKLILEEYDIHPTILGTAVVSALIVAKVVVLLGKTSFGNAFRSRPLALHVLWRSALYTLAVFAVTLLERLFDLYRESGDLADAFVKAWKGEHADHFLAMNIAVGLTLLVYNVYGEIDRHLGEGTLRRLFFGPAPASAPAEPDKSGMRAAGVETER